MLAIMGYNGYIFLSVLAGAGLGYAFFGESMAHAKIQSVKMKAAMVSCGDCQGKSSMLLIKTLNADNCHIKKKIISVKDVSEDNAAGQSDPPTNTSPIASFSGSVGPIEPQV